MKLKLILLVFVIIFLNCKKDNKNKNLESNKENKNIKSTTQNIEFNDLFNEGSMIRFTPKDLENPKNEEEREFKKKLELYEKQNPLIEDFDLDNLKTLVNNQTFSNTEYFINSEWLYYFIKKYSILNLNDIFSLAIDQEDYSAVNVILKTGYIISEEEVNKSLSVLEDSAIKTKYNKPVVHYKKSCSKH